MFRTLACLFLACAWAFGADAAFPLWDGQESVAHYAERTNLPPAKTLDLGNGVNLELVLIPAGKFIMGTPRPQPVDEQAFRDKVFVGRAVLAAGGAILLVLIGFAVVRAIRDKRRFQYSLRRFMAMTFAAGLCLLGGMHWWYSTKALSQAQAEYSAALARYKVAGEDEKPAHHVRLTRPFYMAKFKVTQEQYALVMGANPSWFKGTKLPVETVSWYNAQDFCKYASSKTGQTVRLPTEAEWEFACRAGTTTAFYTGDADSDLGRAAWYGTNSSGTTHPVGLKEPNAFGLHDMHGNLWEWVQDHFTEKYYSDSPPIDPKGPASPYEGCARVLRGGTWEHSPDDCRAARRAVASSGERNVYMGFRYALDF
ncbi:MAG: formylglycine-generating enzyme family protein [Planctomycetota bacterium]